MGLEIVPISLKEANAYVEQHHRHHKPVTGHKFSIGCSDGEKSWEWLLLAARYQGTWIMDGILKEVLKC